MASNIIQAAADAVARADEDHENAGAALAVAVAARNVISGRIAALEEERASILAARRGGDHDDEAQGGRLFLVDADTSDLKVLLSEADAAVAPLQVAARDASQRVAASKMALVTETENEVLRLLIERADSLDKLLLNAATQIEAHKRRLHKSRNLWEPSKALATHLHLLDLTRIK